MSSTGPSGRRKVITLAIVALALVGIVVATLVARDEEDATSDDGYPPSKLTAQEAAAPLPGAPPELNAIRAQANELLGGGPDAFHQRLAELKGTPIVVNVWASWCGPCIYEFPAFQEQATEHGKEVAFLGVDFDDSEPAAKTFLERLPVPYPSYNDPDKEIAESLGVSLGIPATIFIDSKGEIAYRQLGQYQDPEAQLPEQIEQYAN
jgi:cytochrome c biogenesis protein CcmG/thiol:disulfide interchange protein DsbE